MSIDARVSVRPSKGGELDRPDLGAPPPAGLDRLFADTDLILDARSLLLRATSPGSVSAGRAILSDRVARLLGAAPSASVNRAQLEAFAAAERLLDPISRLTAAAEAPPRPTFAWSTIAPEACAELEAALDALRDRVKTPHLAALVRLFDALLDAGDEGAWAEVETLASRQNAEAMASPEPIVLFASLFWTEQGTAWPAIYLVEKKSSELVGPAIERVAQFFVSLDPHRSTPALCFATNLIFAPSKGDANAFALHNQAALIFEVVDAERRARFERLASSFGLDPVEAERLSRIFLAGHEFGHKYDPLNLPKWTEELFADVAGVVASAEVLGGALPPDVLLRVLLVEALSNYARSPEEPPSILYFDSTDQIIARLSALGVIRISDRGEIAVDVDHERWRSVVADFRESFSVMRRGELPRYFRRGAPQLDALRTRISALISSGRA